MSNRKEHLIFVEKLWDEGRRCFDDLTYLEREQLTGLLMAYSKRPYEFITESNYFDNFVDHIAKYLRYESQETTPYECFQNIRDGAINFAKSIIEELFDNIKEYSHENNRPDSV